MEAAAGRWPGQGNVGLWHPERPDDHAQSRADWTDGGVVEDRVANSSAEARRRSARLVFLPTTKTEPAATQDAAGAMGRLRIGRLARVGARPVGVLAVASAVVLLASHSLPWPLGAAAYRVASALPLALVAVAVLGAQVARRAEPVELAKAVLLAGGFGFWAAYQLASGVAHAAVLNDLAIGCFVVDAVLVVVPRDAARAAKAAKQPGSASLLAEAEAAERDPRS